MGYLTNIFLKGLAAALPIFLTLYLVYWLGWLLERLFRPVIVFVLPNGSYWPGMGLVAGLLLLFLIGLLVDAWFVRKALRLGGMILEKIPLIKSVYGSLQDFTTYFADMRKRENLKTVVAIKIGEGRLIGFLTREEHRINLPKGTILNELVAIYIPLSYQIGGFTVFVHRDLIEHLDISVEDAMRLVLTAGLSQNVNHDH